MIQKAQKKPVIVEFIQLRKDNIKEVYTEVHGEPNLKGTMDGLMWDTYQDIVLEDGMNLKTPESGEGTQIADIGDYIVFGYTEKLGRHCWPVKPDYFEQSYDIIG